MANKVSREVAEADVTAWLDKKKVFDSTRESFKDHIDTITDAICEGILVLNKDTFEWVHTLMFPLENERSVTELKYKPRINDKMMRPNLNGVKTGDADGRLNALVATLTGIPRAVVDNLDTADKKVSMAIGIFFL